MSCNIFYTRPSGSGSSGRTKRNQKPEGVPVFAWKGETLEEYWWATTQVLKPDGEGPNLILDDGGCHTLVQRIRI